MPAIARAEGIMFLGYLILVNVTSHKHLQWNPSNLPQLSPHFHPSLVTVMPFGNLFNSGNKRSRMNWSCSIFINAVPQKHLEGISLYLGQTFVLTHVKLLECESGERHVLLVSGDRQQQCSNSSWTRHLPITDRPFFWNTGKRNTSCIQYMFLPVMFLVGF